MKEVRTPYTDTLEELFNQQRDQASSSQKNEGGDFVVSYPVTIEDIRHIIDGLKTGSSALVNFNKVAKVALCQRMMDYLFGAAYALGGNVKKIQEGQYLITSNGVSIKIKQ